MRTLESAAILAIGTALITFASLSSFLFPRPLALSNPTLLVELLFLAGTAFVVMAVRSFYQIQKQLSSFESAICASPLD